METIDAQWLKKRLSGDRGQKAALAEAIGVGTDKISKMISGIRKVQADEIPKILAFFGEASQEVDPELLAIWQKLAPQERVFLLNAAKGLAAEGHEED